MPSWSARNAARPERQKHILLAILLKSRTVVDPSIAGLPLPNRRAKHMACEVATTSIHVGVNRECHDLGGGGGPKCQWDKPGRAGIIIHVHVCTLEIKYKKCYILSS